MRNYRNIIINGKPWENIIRQKVQATYRKVLSKSQKLKEAFKNTNRKLTENCVRHLMNHKRTMRQRQGNHKKPSRNNEQFRETIRKPNENQTEVTRQLLENYKP